MYPYLDRIEVHLSSQPTSKAPCTVVIADGHILGVRTLRNPSRNLVYSKSSFSFSQGSAHKSQNFPLNFDMGSTAFAGHARSNSLTPNTRAVHEQSAAPSPDWAQRHSQLNEVASIGQASGGSSRSAASSYSSSGSRHKRSRTNSYSPQTASTPTSGSFLSNSASGGQENQFLDLPLLDTNLNQPNNDIHDFMTSFTNTTPSIYHTIDSDFPTFDLHKQPDHNFDEAFRSSHFPMEATPGDPSTASSFPPERSIDPPRSNGVREVCSSSVSSEVTSQADEQPEKSVLPSTKRMKKLEAILSSLRVSQTPTLAEHNETVEKLYKRDGLNPSHLQQLTLTRFAAVLENLCDVSSKLGFVYGLLSWEIFRQEEERLTCEEGLSSIAASKAVNKQMVEMLKRRAKTRDWASDGRKAAKIVFDVLQQRSVADRSFAILLLASHASLDGMLKIAHFPATRERFSMEFGHIVDSMVGRWGLLSQSGYKSFDHEHFLHSRGASAKEL